MTGDSSRWVFTPCNLYDEIRDRQKPNNVAAVETGFQHKQLFELINWVTAVVLSAVLGQ